MEYIVRQFYFAAIIAIVVVHWGNAQAQSTDELNEIAAFESKLPKPPKSTKDVFLLLEQNHGNKDEATRFMEASNGQPPTTGSKDELRKFYQQRGYALEALGNLSAARNDYILALEKL